MAVTHLALAWVGWPNGKNLRRLTCKFDMEQSERNARKARPNGVASTPKLSTCESVWPGLKDALANFWLMSTIRKLVGYFTWRIYCNEKVDTCAYSPELCGM